MAPGHALSCARAAVKRWQGYTWAGLLSRERISVRGARRFEICGRQHRRQRYRELPSGPARSKNLCMRGVSRRENREVPRSPASELIAGRAAQGRPRPPARAVPTGFTCEAAEQGRGTGRGGGAGKGAGRGEHRRPDTPRTQCRTWRAKLRPEGRAGSVEGEGFVDAPHETDTHLFQRDAFIGDAFSG